MNEHQTQLALNFIAESNRIEGIKRPPTKEELAEFGRFMSLTEITIEDMKKFVSIYQPDSMLRDRRGMDVRVGRFFPPKGGPDITKMLLSLLEDLKGNRDAYEIHNRYESIHPFIDCNGRSGRMLWAWQMGWDGLGLGFLHRWYYQSLDRRDDHEQAGC